MTAPGAEGGLTTSHYYAGASATRDRRDRDDPSDALALLGRREDSPRRTAEPARRRFPPGCVGLSVCRSRPIVYGARGDPPGGRVGGGRGLRLS